MKRDITVLLAGMGKPKGAPMSDAEPDETMDEMAEEAESGDEDIVAAEVMDAVKSGDAGALKDALKSFIKICMDSEEY